MRLWRWEGDALGAPIDRDLDTRAGVTARDLDGDGAPELIGANDGRGFAYDGRSDDVRYTCD